MPNIKNTDSVKDIREKVAKAKAIVVADYHGLKVNQINDLRSRLSAQGMEMAVTKNTLLKIALKEENVTLGDFESHLKMQLPLLKCYLNLIENMNFLLLKPE